MNGSIIIPALKLNHIYRISLISESLAWKNRPLSKIYSAYWCPTDTLEHEKCLLSEIWETKEKEGKGGGKTKISDSRV